MTPPVSPRLESHGAGRDGITAGRFCLLDRLAVQENFALDPAARVAVLRADVQELARLGFEQVIERQPDITVLLCSAEPVTRYQTENCTGGAGVAVGAWVAVGVGMLTGRPQPAMTITASMRTVKRCIRAPLLRENCGHGATRDPFTVGRAYSSPRSTCVFPANNFSPVNSATRCAASAGTSYIP